MGSRRVRQHCLCPTSVLQGLSPRWIDCNQWGWWLCSLKVWAPEVILHNSVEEKFIYRQVRKHLLYYKYTIYYIQYTIYKILYTIYHKLYKVFWKYEGWMSPQIGVVHHTGHFVYVIAVHSKSACSPNFEGFPWGMQVIWVLPPRFPVRFAVFSLGRGSTASMGLSTDCLEIAPLASPISNPLLDGRSPLQRNPKTLFVNIFPGGEYQIQTGVRPCQKSFGNFDYILILQYMMKW